MTYEKYNLSFPVSADVYCYAGNAKNIRNVKVVGHVAGGEDQEIPIYFVRVIHSHKYIS